MNPITAITISVDEQYARLWVRIAKPRRTPNVQWPVNANYRQPDLMLEALDSYADRFPKRRSTLEWRFMAYDITEKVSRPQRRIRITKPLLLNDRKRGAEQIECITFDEAYDTLRCHVQLLLT